MIILYDYVMEQFTLTFKMILNFFKIIMAMFSSF